MAHQAGLKADCGKVFQLANALVNFWTGSSLTAQPRQTGSTLSTMGGNGSGPTDQPPTGPDRICKISSLMNSSF